MQVDNNDGVDGAEGAQREPSFGALNGEALPTPPAPRLSRLSNWRDTINNPKRKVEEQGAAGGGGASRNVKPTPLNRPGVSASTLSLADAVRLDLPQLHPSISAPQLRGSPPPGAEPSQSSPSAAAAAAPSAGNRDAAKDSDTDMQEATSLAKNESASDLMAATVTPPQVCSQQRCPASRQPQAVKSSRFRDAAVLLCALPPAAPPEARAVGRSAEPFGWSAHCRRQGGDRALPPCSDLQRERSRHLIPAGTRRPAACRGCSQ